MKATAIIPAFNEAKTISAVINVLLDSPYINEVIVVDDASEDETVAIVENNFPTVKIVQHTKNKGKADALVSGAQAATHELLFFCDADLIGLTQEHLKELFEPVLAGEAQMVCGAQEYMRKWDRFWFYRTLLRLKGEEPSEKKIDEFFMGLGGERVLYKSEFLRIKGLKNSHYGVEYKINFHYLDNDLPHKFIILEGVDHVWKFDKWDFRYAATKEFPAIATFASQKIYKYFKYKQ